MLGRLVLSLVLARLSAYAWQLFYIARPVAMVLFRGMTASFKKKNK